MTKASTRNRTSWFCSKISLWVILVLVSSSRIAQGQAEDLDSLFSNPPASASPWEFWHWTEGCVSEKGISAELETMKRSGIAEAYLMPIEGPDQKPLPEPPIVQLSPIWWAMVPHAMQAADRLGPMRTFASTATFRNLCMWQEPKIEGKRYWLNLGTMACIAAWTAPSRVEISKQLRPSANEVEISVTNTWANRRIGVRHLPSDFSATRTSASPMSEDVELQLSGLLGPVEIVTK